MLTQLHTPGRRRTSPLAPALWRCGRTAIALSLLALASLAHAQPALTEQDFLSDMPVVLSVSRLPQPLDETPGAVTVIDRDTIARLGARDVADLMRMVPGFLVSNAFESVAPLVSYHGMFDSYSNRTELLIDGRSVYSSYFIGSIGPGLQTVALQDIERIEVLRGSNSAALGARAMLGVINIITRHSADTPGARTQVNLGEQRIRDAYASVGAGSSGATWRLSADTRHDDGLINTAAPVMVQRANLRADLRPSAQDDLELRVGALRTTSGKGYVGVVDEPARESLFTNGYLQLDWRRSLSADHDVALRVSHTQERYHDEFLYDLRPLHIADTLLISGSGQARSEVLSVQSTVRHNAHWRSVAGLEWRNERITSPALYDTPDPLDNRFSRLFGNLEWRPASAWVVNAGLMAEHSSRSGSSLAPRLMVNWHAAPGQTWRAGISRAFRPPSTYEQSARLVYRYQGQILQVNTISSGQVEPEALRAYELGYLGEFPRWGLNLDVRAFREQLSGFIRQLNKTRPRDYANDESFAIQGVEAQARLNKLWPGAELWANVAYTHIGARLYPPDDLELIRPSGTPYAAPRWGGTLTLFQKLPYNLDLTLQHTNQSVAVLAGSGWGSRRSLQRTDLRLARALRWGQRHGELALAIQNLGQPYPDFKSTFQMPRQAFVSLNLDF
ncbi:MAG: hypothetical protein OHK0048_16340 [Rhodoferax sp.]